VIDLAIPAHPEIIPDAVSLATAKNSWTQFAVQIDCAQFPAHPVLRLPRFAGVSASAFQVLSVPVDLNDAGYVRQTGEPGRTHPVPRVLLPLPMNGGDGGGVDLTAVRDPANPAAADAHPNSGSVLIWIDLNISPRAVPGDYIDRCELSDAQGQQSAGVVPVHLTIENLTLPAERHLHFTAPLDWPTLTAINPSEFEALTPRLLSRGDGRIVAMLRILDGYIELAHDNKSDLFVPRLQPIVKWPLGKLPEVDWTNFDSVVSPWLTGKAFADRTPVAFWPLPAPDSLANFDLRSRIQYWQFGRRAFRPDAMARPLAGCSESGIDRAGHRGRFDPAVGRGPANPRDGIRASTPCFRCRMIRPN